MTVSAPIERLAAPAMTRDEVERILRAWQERLYLTHWQITIKWDDPLDTDLGEALSSEAYDQASIRISREWQSWTPIETNRTLVHELMHLLMRNQDGAAEAVEPLLNAQARALHAARYENAKENVVERLAIILVDLGGCV